MEFIVRATSASVCGSRPISQRTSCIEFLTTSSTLGIRLVMNAGSACSTGSSPVTSSASTTASSAHIAAPWAISGGQACAASPITIARPRYQGSSTSSHSILVCETLESAPMVSRIVPQVPP